MAETEEPTEGDSDTQETEGGTPEPTEVEDQPDVPVFELDGEQYTQDQIKEWKMGYLRQSDYTKKTQEIASARKEHQQALDLYDYLKENPEVAEKLSEFEKETQGKASEQTSQVQQNLDPNYKQLQLEINTLKIEKDLDNLKKTDPDLDEIKVLEIANDEGVSVDKAYKLWVGENVDSIVKNKLKQQSEQVKKNGDTTSTLINPTDGKPDESYGLNENEIAIANKLNMTPSDYAKYKTYKR